MSSKSSTQVKRKTKQGEKETATQAVKEQVPANIALKRLNEGPNKAVTPGDVLSAQQAVGNKATEAALQRKAAAPQAQPEVKQVPVPAPAITLKPEEMIVARLRQKIKDAAAQHNVDPNLVAAILADEAKRRGLDDALQDTEARFIIAYEGLLERGEVAMWETVTGESLANTSFGASQMNASTLQDMVDQGRIPAPAGWNGDKLDKTLEMLLSDDLAPTLVAARLRQTIDHWASGRVNIANRPEILGTLYSLGLHGRSGINPNPQANERGNGIAATMPRMRQILEMPVNGR